MAAREDGANHPEADDAGTGREIIMNYYRILVVFARAFHLRCRAIRHWGITKCPPKESKTGRT